jgi:hypothetical protein
MPCPVGGETSSGYSLSKDGWMAVYLMYVDESGKLSGKDPKYTCLCGYIGHHLEWQNFTLLWNRCRFRHSVPPIHMSRIMSPDNKNDAWKRKKEEWGDLWVEKRDRLLEELAEIVAGSGIVCVGIVVDAAAYKRIKVESGCILHYERFQCICISTRHYEGVRKGLRCGSVLPNQHHY